MSLDEARGFNPENKTRGPKRSKIIDNRSGNPISNFFHHSIFEPSTFPLKNRELHLAMYNLPNIYSSLIQSNILRDVLAKVQSENILN